MNLSQNFQQKPLMYASLEQERAAPGALWMLPLED